MKLALLNPAWDFGGSIYFGCREPHLPLEYGYTRALLEHAGHEVAIVDGQLGGLSHAETIAQTAALDADVAVVTTAPSYLFWRCAPPELRVPMRTVRDLRAASAARGRMPLVVAVGPHASSTPGVALRKLDADVAVLGECEEIVARLADAIDRGQVRRREELPDALARMQSIAFWHAGEPVVRGTPHASAMADLPALRWSPDAILRHRHHHHRFDRAPEGPGAEIEFSRGCPYRCTFCAKENFRNKYRKRSLGVVLEELDGLIALGARYVYFIDEIFLPDRHLLEALVERDVQFGVQTRIDLWDTDLLDLLGRAGCVSIEAGVESITPEGRQLLDKRCKLTTEELADLLIFSRRHVPFVQANLLEAQTDDATAVEAWRTELLAHGVWANKPVPLFPYPGSPDYTNRWGRPDDRAWERAHAAYLGSFDEFSDIQDDHPLPLPTLEADQTAVQPTAVGAPLVGALGVSPVRPQSEAPVSLRLRFALFYHSLVSDWNHGNAHFLRGIASDLLARGHGVTVYEPAHGWSRGNLLVQHGTAPLGWFRSVYPELRSALYDADTLDLDAVLAPIDVAIVHEWNEPALVRRIGAWVRQRREAGAAPLLFFHDTHHRAITDPQAMASYDLSGYDGVLAFGAVLRERYLAQGWAGRAWVWHEAADVRVFHPIDVDDGAPLPSGDLVWIGNWGDDERSEELHEFVLQPARALGLRGNVYGVRYPPNAHAMLEAVGLTYRGWLPNYEAPRVFARHRVTVHVPRRPYAQSLPGIPTIRVFEALACGIPLVCAPWHDGEGLFTPGEDYLVAQDGAQMRRQLRDVLASPDLARALSTHGLRTIRARHTCAHRVDELLRMVAGLRDVAGRR